MGHFTSLHFTSLHFTSRHTHTHTHTLLLKVKRKNLNGFYTQRLIKNRDRAFFFFFFFFFLNIIRDINLVSRAHVSQRKTSIVDQNNSTKKHQLLHFYFKRIYIYYLTKSSVVGVSIGLECVL